jgi:hypothetical protein
MVNTKPRMGPMTEKKAIFPELYKGPRGRHLACLTHFSIYGKPRDVKFDESIHPFGRSGKHSTMKRKSRSTILRAIEGLRTHIERHPNDVMSAANLARLEAM